MREGMLWFDNSEHRTHTEKIDRAARYYADKYGTRPTAVFVHPTLLLDGPISVDGADVRATPSVLPNHFWLGQIDTSQASAAGR